MSDPNLPADHLTVQQFEELLVRVATLTETLRRAAPGETSDRAMKQLLADVGVIVTQLRSRSTPLAGSLDRAKERLRDALEQISE